MLFDQRTQTVVPHDQKSNFTQHTSSYSADLEVDERTLKTNGVSLLRDARSPIGAMPANVPGDAPSFRNSVRVETQS